MFAVVQIQSEPQNTLHDIKLKIEARISILENVMEQTFPNRTKTSNLASQKADLHVEVINEPEGKTGPNVEVQGDTFEEAK